MCHCCVGRSLKNWNVSALVISLFVNRGCSSDPRLVPSSAAVSLISANAPTGGVPESTQRASAFRPSTTHLSEGFR